MPIITTITQLRNYVSVGAALSFDSIKPSIFKAETKYLQPLLGLPLYEWLSESINANNPAYTTLSALALNASANLALWLYVPVGGVQIDDMGIYQAKTTDTWRLAESELRKLEAHYCQDAMDALDALVAHLEANAAAPNQGQNPSTYTPYQRWHAAPQRVRYNELLIKNADTFERYAELYRSTLTFFTLKTIIYTVQTQHLAKLMGDYLPSLVSMADPADNHAKILRIAQEALAKLTIAHALQLGRHTLENARLTFNFQIHKVDADVIATYQNIGQNALQSLRNILEEVRPEGYTPLPTTVTDNTLLRNPTSTIILA